MFTNKTRLNLSKIKEFFNFPQFFYKKTDSEIPQFHMQMFEDMHFEEQRRNDLPIIKDHPTQTFNVKGESVEIDKDMMPLVDWMNNHLKDTFTHFCCQGDVYHPLKNTYHQRPYLTWSSEPLTVKKILKLFNDFYITKDMPSNCYKFIETEVYIWEDELRYTTRWFDNVALHDFIMWAGNRELLTPHFKENYNYLTQSWK